MTADMWWWFRTCPDTNDCTLLIACLHRHDYDFTIADLDGIKAAVAADFAESEKMSESDRYSDAGLQKRAEGRIYDGRVKVRIFTGGQKMQVKDSERVCEIMEEMYSRFTQALMEKIAADPRLGNLVISPFSLAVLLDMMAEAAAGKTRDEVWQVLGNGLAYEQVRDGMEKLQSAIEAGTEMRNVNAVCVNVDVRHTIRQEFLENFKERFKGELFTSDSAVNINRWVSEKTNGLIGQVVDDSVQNIPLMLMNVVAFEDEWSEGFREDNIREDEFTNADQTVSKVTMLHGRVSSYIENDFVTGFLKSYKGGKFTFMALLPKQEGDAAMKEAAEQLNFVELYRNASPEIVDISMPEFECSFDMDLNRLFAELGIYAAFTSDADFSPMTAEKLKADKIIHKARIEVDRKGTKAAAFSGMTSVVKSMDRIWNKKVNLNRPFLYAIVHKQTGLPVFVGRQSRMKGKTMR